jgi:hypothetical protein
MGVANEAAKAEVNFYKTGDESFQKLSSEIYSSYHEFDEVVAKTMEIIFFDFVGDEENLNRLLRNWNIFMKTGRDSRYEKALILYDLYKKIGLSHFLKKVERLMQDKQKIELVL